MSDDKLFTVLFVGGWMGLLWIMAIGGMIHRFLS